MEGWWEDLTEDCRLMNFESWQAKVSVFDIGLNVCSFVIDKL